MAVGKLEKKDISHRCAVWAEPSVVEAAAYEFAQTEDFLTMAEDLAGKKYVWGRYDLLCLPGSFPFGGTCRVSNSLAHSAAPQNTQKSQNNFDDCHYGINREKEISTAVVTVTSSPFRILFLQAWKILV